jgi:predicted metalloprotease
MQWTPGDRSNVEDNRGRSGIAMGGMGLGGALLVLFLSWATGTDFSSLITSPATTTGDSAATSGQVNSSPAEERQVDFVDAVMKDVQESWNRLLPGKYRSTKLVLFRDALDSACGLAQSATGPFYCPEDARVYLDLGFFDELQRRFGAPGEFARAYVIAHEVGHHVQRLLGIMSSTVASVPLELQADCFAGVWGHTASQPGRAAQGRVELDPGDAEEGLRAAAAIGDDRLQKMTTGHVAPERFTHGTSAQRVEWLRRGLTSGSPDACDTFGRRGTR